MTAMIPERETANTPSPTEDQFFATALCDTWAKNSFPAKGFVRETVRGWWSSAESPIVVETEVY